MPLPIRALAGLYSLHHWVPLSIVTLLEKGAVQKVPDSEFYNLRKLKIPAENQGASLFLAGIYFCYFKKNEFLYSPFLRWAEKNLGLFRPKNAA